MNKYIYIYANDSLNFFITSLDHINFRTNKLKLICTTNVDNWILRNQLKNLDLNIYVKILDQIHIFYAMFYIINQGLCSILKKKIWWFYFVNKKVL